MASAPGPDPIYAAIEKHRRAYATMQAVSPNTGSDDTAYLR